MITDNTKSINKSELPERLMSMSSHVLIIYDSIEFLQRVRKALTKAGLQYQMRLVEYLDLNTHQGNKTFSIKII